MLPKSLDTIRIDINSGKVRKSVAVCQNDNVQRTLNFLLVNSGTALDLSNLLFAEILIKKADNFEADNGCVIDGNSIQYTLRTTDVSAIGTNVAQLQLTFKDGQVLTTPSFEIEVYSKVLNQKVQQSLNEYTALTEQLVLINEIKSDVEESAEDAAASANSAEIAANSAAGYIGAISEYAATAEGYISQAGNYMYSASDFASDAESEAAKAESLKETTSEYLASASEYASVAVVKASETADNVAVTSEYIASASEYASTAASESYEASLYAGEANSLKVATSEHASYASSQASVANSCAMVADESAEDAEAWAVGKRDGVNVSSDDPAYNNSAKYWRDRAQAAAESVSGSLRPMGTVAFANLPSIASSSPGDMYNISDEFTTTNDFLEGPGIVVNLGSNVYLTESNKWDILAGSPVTGIKGNAESNYRKGNVNITPANIGLGNVDNESLGTASIANIGDGTTKGAISTLLNDISTNIENGSTASKSYVAGKFIVRSGAIYKVTSNIAIGAAFSGANVEATDIAEQLSQLITLYNTLATRVSTLEDNIGYPINPA